MPRLRELELNIGGLSAAQTERFFLLLPEADDWSAPKYLRFAGHSLSLAVAQRFSTVEYLGIHVSLGDIADLDHLGVIPSLKRLSLDVHSTLPSIGMATFAPIS